MFYNAQLIFFPEFMLYPNAWTRIIFEKYLGRQGKIEVVPQALFLHTFITNN